MKAATWTDYSSQFILPPWISGTSTPNVTDPEANAYGTPYDSGTVDITSWFHDYETPVYFAFFYHVDKSDANFVDEKTGKPNNRTIWDLYYCRVSKSYPGDSKPSVFFRFEGADQSSVELVKPASWNASNPCAKNTTAAGQKVIRMTEANKPSGNRDAYCITHAIYRPAAQIISSDTGITVPAADEGYAYVFANPGIYNIGFRSRRIHARRQRRGCQTIRNHGNGMIMKQLLKIVASAVLLLLTCGGAAAQPILRLPSVIGDHMVLQENTNAKIWGWAERKMRYRLSRHGHRTRSGPNRPVIPNG